MRQVLAGLSPEMSELDAAADLAFEAQRRGFTTPVVLVAGDVRQRVHRHPLPTEASLGSHGLLAITAEREGLHVSLTRLVSFGTPPDALRRLVQAAAEVDAAMLAASVPGATTGDVLAVAAAAYGAHGFPEEWRHHHQGGLTGYRGREVFAVPGEPTRLPMSCAVAWNPSITGGAKSEDTALVTEEGVEFITRTEDLGELATPGIPRPAIVEL
jgi:antitoxin VapB